MTESGINSNWAAPNMNNFQPEKLYQNGYTNNLRWRSFKPRQGDILICTPSKSGTTWMQSIVAHLIFEDTLPRPVNEMSPWFDFDKNPLEEITEQLEAQSHRRFIKTHTPFDGLPHLEDVTYIHVARNPLDVMLSMVNHMENYKSDLPGRSETEDLEAMFDRWITSTVDDWATHAGLSIGYLFHHVKTFFERRAAPNIHLFHYSSLKSETERELQRLAKALNIEVPKERWPAILDGISLENMRKRANEFAPDAHKNTWKDPARFFHSGRQGEAAARLSEDQMARYRAKAEELASPDLLHWIEEGA